MMLSGTDDIRVVAEVADGAEVASAVDAYKPDLVLMDIRMPRMDGLAATELLRGRDDAPAVIVLTTFDADDHVLRALRAGASGFLLKDTPPPEILKAVRLVAGGEAMLSPTVTRRLLEHRTHEADHVRNRHVLLANVERGTCFGALENVQSGGRMPKSELVKQRLLVQG